MITIWRYEHAITDRFELDMAAPGTIVAVREHRANPAGLEFWAVADTDSPEDRVSRPITIVGTGHALPDDVGEYLGTTFHGPLVFHVYGGEPVRT